MEPTYRIAQRLHERRAAKGLATYGRHLDADSQGCMLVHALEESADNTNYLIAEVQRRKAALELLTPLRDSLNVLGHDAFVDTLASVIDLLGGESALAQYDKILGTVAENATVAPGPRDELEAAQEELRRLTQANGDLRKERDRAVAEAQRQDSVAKGLRKERDALAADNARLRAALGKIRDRALPLGLDRGDSVTQLIAEQALAATPAQSLAAHDAALLRRLAAESAPGERAYIAPWLLAEADRIEQEENK